MFRLRRLLAGTAIGGISGLLASVLFLSATVLVFGIQFEANDVVRALAILLPFGCVNGAAIGGASTGLRNTLNVWEMLTLGLLLSLAMGSVMVLSGQFAARSRMPFAIYGLAVLNGISVLPSLLLIGAAKQRNDKRSTTI